MKALNKETAPKTQRPERIIQFGEGNFLRAFVDWIIYNMNQKTDFNSSVVVVQPIDKGMVDMLNAQDDLYHVFQTLQRLVSLLIRLANLKMLLLHLIRVN